MSRATVLRTALSILDVQHLHDCHVLLSGINLRITHTTLCLSPDTADAERTEQFTDGPPEVKLGRGTAYSGCDQTEDGDEDAGDADSSFSAWK